METLKTTDSTSVMKDRLLDKIGKHEALIGIIGLGYVGLPLILRFGEVGFPVYGFDVDEKKVEDLERGHSYIKHIPSEQIQSLISSGRFKPTVDFDLLTEVDCIIICVPTPLTEKRDPDLKYVEQTTEEIASRLRPGQLISLESTTYPGTSHEVMLPMLSRSGLQVGQDFFLVYSPEREDPGNPVYNTRNIPKVVGGTTPVCLELGKALYEKTIDKVIPVSSTAAAELTKLLENIFRCVNIALVNELKILTQRMGVDIWEVIQAASSKPFGFMPFYPGPGLGGHCIPIDPFYLSWKAREYDFVTKFIELAGEVNTNIPYYVVDRVTDALNRSGKCLKGAKILILGVAYKKDVDDMRESPSLKLIQLLSEKGCRVSYNDPYISAIPRTRKYDFNLKSVELNEGNLREFDAVVVSTDHSAYDYEWIVANAEVVVDTRNATKDVTKEREKIVKA